MLFLSNDIYLNLLNWPCYLIRPPFTHLIYHIHNNNFNRVYNIHKPRITIDCINYNLCLYSTYNKLFYITKKNIQHIAWHIQYPLIPWNIPGSPFTPEIGKTPWNLYSWNLKVLQSLNLWNGKGMKCVGISWPLKNLKSTRGPLNSWNLLGARA